MYRRGGGGQTIQAKTPTRRDANQMERKIKRNIPHARDDGLNALGICFQKLRWRTKKIERGGQGAHRQGITPILTFRTGPSAEFLLML